MLLISADFLRRRLSSEQLGELCLALGMCLECGGSLVRVEGEVVCVKCGMVWGFENVEEAIPFPEEGEARALSNAQEVGAQLLKSWEGRKTSAHLFITLLETGKKKKAIENKLEEIRLQTASTTQQTNNTEGIFR
ncbi:MAG: hypothetical protein QXI91_06245 [Candidatus Bathyarchaeia archaeon]